MWAQMGFRTSLLVLLVTFLGSHQAVIGANVNITGSDRNVSSSSEDHSLNVTEVTVTGDYEESEGDENEDDLPESGYTEDLIRVEPVVKPKSNKKSEKKNDKKRKRTGKGKANKKKEVVNPCETTHQSYCLHGECRYLEIVQQVACICHEHYFGVRCIERSLESRKEGDLSDISMTALAVVAVLLSAISFIAIIIIIVVHSTHKKCSNGYEGEVEEKKRLGQENGSGELDV